MRVVSFFVPGPPQGKQRSRSTRSGHHYTPKKTVEYEKEISDAYRKVDGMLPPLETPVKISICAIYLVPVSWSNRKRSNARFTPPTVKPDVDNILKVVADALNGIAWKDDKQIVAATIYKKYDTVAPGLFIRITELVP